MLVFYSILSFHYHLLTIFEHDYIIKWSVTSVRKEVANMRYIISLIVAIAANVAAYYICKWLDSHDADE